MASFHYREECYGYSAGQTDCSIYAYDNDKIIGHLDFAYHKVQNRKEAYIKMIEVNPSYQGQGVGRQLIQQLVQSVPYDAIDWGGTTADGGALKAIMDRYYGTSYKPTERDEELDPFEALVKRQSFKSGSAIYKGKLKELKKIVQEAVRKALFEAGYDQYGEGFCSTEEIDLKDSSFKKGPDFKCRAVQKRKQKKKE